MFGKILQYVLARATEKTSIAGYIAMIAAALNWQINQGQNDAIASLIAAVVAVVLVFIPGGTLAKVIK